MRTTLQIATTVWAPVLAGLSSATLGAQTPGTVSTSWPAAAGGHIAARCDRVSGEGIKVSVASGGRCRHRRSSLAHLLCQVQPIAH